MAAALARLEAACAGGTYYEELQSFKVIAQRKCAAAKKTVQALTSASERSAAPSVADAAVLVTSGVACCARRGDSFARAAGDLALLLVELCAGCRLPLDTRFVDRVAAVDAAFRDGYVAPLGAGSAPAVAAGPPPSGSASGSGPPSPLPVGGVSYAAPLFGLGAHAESALAKEHAAFLDAIFGWIREGSAPQQQQQQQQQVAASPAVAAPLTPTTPVGSADDALLASLLELHGRTVFLIGDAPRAYVSFVQGGDVRSLTDLLEAMVYRDRYSCAAAAFLRSRAALHILARGAAAAAADAAAAAGGPLPAGAMSTADIVAAARVALHGPEEGPPSRRAARRQASPHCVVHFTEALMHLVEAGAAAKGETAAAKVAAAGDALLAVYGPLCLHVPDPRLEELAVAVARAFRLTATRKAPAAGAGGGGFGMLMSLLGGGPTAPSAAAA